ncbi:MAG TPA: MATE family efflux transporter [Gemmatimonadaceae bacterium]|nr:MATE family efflux transporter [Gemmatimonadaceae bacterium]
MTEATTAAPAAPAAVTPDVAARPGRRKYDRSIIEGPLLPAVWKLAWPTMLTNVVGGLQAMVDQVLVGNLIGPKANAAIGDSNQIFLIVVIFIASLFSGMSVLVARFVGQGDHDKADRTVYQAFITSIGLAVFILGPIGYFASPALLDFVNAAPEVKAEALPFLRISFLFSSGMLVFFMLSGALRSAGDARTPMILGISLTVLNVVFNVILIRGLGPIPAFGTKGAAMGTSIASGVLAIYSLYKLWHGGWVVSFPRGKGWGPDWEIIRALFRFGLPTGFQGIAMNIGGVLMLAFIGSVPNGGAAQAAFAVCYSQLFSLVTWTSVGLMGAAAAVAGQNLGAGQPDRAAESVHVAARIGISTAAFVGILFMFLPHQLLGIFGMRDDTMAVHIGVQLLRVLSVSGLFIAVALTYTGGLQGTGDTKSPLYISIISQMVVPLGICFVVQRVSRLDPIDIWLAILAGHLTRCTLSVLRFNQGRWRTIAVDIKR